MVHEQRPGPSAEFRTACEPLAGHEASDVRFRAVLIGVVVVVLLGAGQFYWVWLFFRDTERQANESRQADGEVTTHELILPPEPRLEQLDRVAGIETSEVRAIEAPKERLLSTYGATDETGFIHIPIQRAMDLALDQLPVRKQPPSRDGLVKDRGLLDSGESNSGRLFREETP